MRYNYRMLHDHHHDHHHHHHGAGKALAIGIALNSLFLMAEIVYGVLANSLALLADAGHNFGDVMGLCLAWGANWLAGRKSSPRFTYGLQSASILAALANAAFLLIAVGGVGWEALQRLVHPEAVSGFTVIIVAAAGVCINTVSAWFFLHGGHHDLNIRSAYRHMVADAAVSLGVVISGLLIMRTGWLWLDPLASLLIALAIVYGTFDLLREAIGMALHAVPKGIDLHEVRKFLLSLPGVADVHDLHIWATSTTETALSAHLSIPDGHPGDMFIHEVNHELESRFHIGHATLQIEITQEAADCHVLHHCHA